MIEYFTEEEFACKCDRGDKCTSVDKKIDPVLRIKLNGMRRELGEAIILTSAIRCPYWNKKVGGVDDSQHVLCAAVDVKTKNAEHAARIVVLAIKHGITGIGVAKGFVHLDVRPGRLRIFDY